MNTDLTRFSGWLLIFYIGLCLGLLLCLGAAIYFITLDIVLIYKSIYILDFLMSAFLIFRMLIIVKQKDLSAPDKLILVLTFYFLVSILFIFGEVLVHYALMGTAGLEDLVGELGQSGMRVVIWYLIWTSYFKKSKRVLAYYGKNADSKIQRFDLKVIFK